MFLAERKMRNYHKLCTWELPIFSAFHWFFIICLLQRDFHPWGKTEKQRLGLFWRTFSCSCFFRVHFPFVFLLLATATFLVCSEHFLGELSKSNRLKRLWGKIRFFKYFAFSLPYRDHLWFTRLYSLAIEGNKSLLEGFVFFFPFAHSKDKKRKPRERLTYSKVRLFTSIFHTNWCQTAKAGTGAQSPLPQHQLLLGGNCWNCKGFESTGCIEDSYFVSPKAATRGYQWSYNAEGLFRAPAIQAKMIGCL